MGNYSRNTYDPTKCYSSVRLQQGVPLVDADWNELDDIARNELYSSIALAIPDGVQPGRFSTGMSALGAGGTNDFYITSGQALVGGRFAQLPSNSTWVSVPSMNAFTYAYSGQPWTNAAKAASIGVSVIPPLTTPAVARTDLIYLDVWEREVNGNEDTNLINPAIGSETCVRLKRETAVRVNEGSTALPSPASGHSFLPLALLNRTANNATITWDQVQDIRPQIGSTRGMHTVSFLPAFLPFVGVLPGFLWPNTAWTPWVLGVASITPNLSSVAAVKASNLQVAGLLPVVLPDGAAISEYSVSGYSGGNVGFGLYRQTLASPYVCTVLGLGVVGTGLFDFSNAVASDQRINIVDPTKYIYFFGAGDLGTNYISYITGISVSYIY